MQKAIFVRLWFSVTGTETSITTTTIKQYTTDETLAPTTKTSRQSDYDNITSVPSNGGNQTTNYTLTQPCCVSPNDTYQTSGGSSKTITISSSKTTMDDQPLGSNTTVETTEAPRNNQTIDIPGDICLLDTTVIIIYFLKWFLQYLILFD